MRQGDSEAKEQLVSGNLKLVLSIVQRFAHRAENMDDLFQIGCIGLIKAIDHFDLNHEVRFSTYAVPMIIGEIKRYLRDNQMIRVSRHLKDLAYKVLRQKEEMTHEWQREPTLSELAERMGNITVDVSWPELAGRQALLDGQGERVTLSADGAAALLERAGEKAGGLRARIYSAFLLAGMDRLNTLIPDFLRSASGDLDTDILATDIYDYQRILDYLALLQPEMLFGELTFTETGEPAGESLQLAAQMFR